MFTKVLWRCLFLFIWTHSILAGPLDRWESSAGAAKPTSLTVGRGLLTGVGSSGLIVVSQDGTHWERRFAPSTNDFIGVAFGQNQFIAITSKRDVLISNDTISWQPASVTPTGDLLSVSFENNEFFISDKNKNIYRSSNGLNWTTLTVPAAFHQIAFGNGIYVAAGGSLYTSPDGINWTERVNHTQFTAVSFAKEAFFAFRLETVSTGASFRSTDGVQWTPFNPGYHKASVVYHLGKYLIVAYNGEVYSSQNGLTWSGIHNLRTGTYFFAKSNLILFKDLLYLALGTQRGTILSTADGSSWVEKYPGSNLFVDQVIESENEIFGLNQTKVARIQSLDKVQWAELATPVFSSTIQSITRLKGTYIAVGNSGAVYTSPDFSQWTRRRTPTDRHLRDVGVHDNMAVIVGDNGIILTSTDGVEWSAQDSGVTLNLKAVTSLGNRLIVVGDYGTTLYSTGGLSWTLNNAPTFNHLYDVVAYPSYTLQDGSGGSQSVAAGAMAVGQQGAVIQTEDGSNWVSRNSGEPGDFGSITFGSGIFIANSIMGNQLARVSIDNGTNWTPLTTRPVSKNVRYWKGRFFTAGSWLYQSGMVGGLTEITMPNPQLTEQLKAYVSSEPGSLLRVEKSSDFSTWEPVFDFDSTLPYQDIALPWGPNDSVFWRVRTR